MDKKHIVQFSGGKDSTALLLMMLEKGMKVDEVIFSDTGKEFPGLYRHIEQVEAYTGLTVTRLKAPRSFDYYFTEHIRKRGKYAGQAGYGWPSMTRRWCTRELKITPTANYLKGKGEYISYLGIAADEPDRHARIKKNERHPLYDWGVTEADALQYCYDRGFTWDGLYDLFPRVSCYLCPMQRISGWRTLRKHFPDLYADALKLDEQSGYKMTVRHSLRDLEDRFKKEDESDAQAE